MRLAAAEAAANEVVELAPLVPPPAPSPPPSQPQIAPLAPRTSTPHAVAVPRTMTPHAQQLPQPPRGRASGQIASSPTATLPAALPRHRRRPSKSRSTCSSRRRPPTAS